MSIEKAREHLAKFNRDKDIMEFEVSSATVDLAAEALGVDGARIAKTLAFKKDDGCILIAVAGDCKVDNKKFKSTFGLKAKMLTPEEALELTNHSVGGVCGFGVGDKCENYTDISLKRFETVFPACGSSNSAIELSCDELYEYMTAKEWVDVSKDWE